MGLITVSEHPLDAPAHTDTHIGAYIDWLLANYPGGFEGQHRSMLNGRHLAVDDYDTVLGEHDRLQLSVLPAGAAIAGLATGFAAVNWSSIIATALVGAAVSYGINALFASKPTTPSALRTPAPGSAYNINAPRNVAKLGERVPVQYGRVVFAPDAAAEPYAYYDDNDQLLWLLLCLGEGEFDVHQVRIADTPLDQLDADIADYWLYGPTAHGETMGAIEADCGIYEDVVTSIEVGDQELQSDATPTSGTTTVIVPALGDPSVSGDSVTIAADVGGSVLRAWVGDAVTVTEYRATRDLSSTAIVATSLSDHALTAPPGGGEVVGAIDTATTLTGGSVSLGNDYSETVQTYTAILATVATSSIVLTDASASPSGSAQRYRIQRTDGALDVAAQASQTLGPFAAVGPWQHARKVQIDIVMPAGLFTMDDASGALLPATLGLRITITVIDDAGTPIGIDRIEREEITAATNTALRKTYTYSISPPRRVAVTLERTTAPSERAQDQSKAYWTGLRGVRPLATTPIYGEATLLAVRLKATNGINGAAADRIIVDATRKLDGAATANPAPAFSDLWTHQIYGGGRPLAELDLDAIEAMRYAAYNANGFNARFDRPTSLWDALRAITRPVDWYPVPLGSQITLVEDSAQTTPVLQMDASNTANVQLAYTFDEPDAADGFDVAYRSATTGQDASTVYPASAVNPERVELFGCTSGATAAAFARGLWQRRMYRRQTVLFDAELEGHLLQIGKLIELTSAVAGTLQIVPRAVKAIDEHHTKIEAFVYDGRVWS